VLILRGPAGAGKSALLRDAVERADGMQVLQARGVESEAELAFATLHQLLRPVLGQVDALPHPQAKALRAAFGLEQAAGDDRFLVSVAVLSLLAEAAERVPVLCVLDDAHWLDEASANALAFAARRLEAERVAMLVAAREGGLRRFGAAGLPELKVAGLDRVAVGSLLVARAGVTVADDVRDQLVEQTGGNPLALTELPSVLTPGQLAGNDPLPVPLPLTEGVEHAFLDRVRRLDQDAQTFLLVAAADDTGRLATVLAAAEALGAEGALDTAERAGLVHVHDAQLEFHHPLVRSAIYQGATTSRRHQAHRALAEVLEGEGDADRRAWHLAAAVTGPDERVAGELDDAARRAAGRGGFEAARAALERAAELTAEPAARGRRLVEATENAWLAGQLGHVARLLAAARPLASDPLVRADVDRLRGWVEISVGSAAAAHRILVQAAEAVAPADARRAGRMLAAAAESAWLNADRDAGAELGPAAARLAGAGAPAGHPHQAFFMDLVAGFLHWLDGDAATAIRLLTGAIGLARNLDDPVLLGLAAHHAFYVGDDEAAAQLNGRIVAGARADGAVAELLFALPRLAQAELLTGRWTAAAAGAAEAARLARETGQPGLSALPLAWLTLLAALQGDEDHFWARAAETDEVAATHALGIFEHAVHDIVQYARAVQKLATARPASAVAVLDDLAHPVIARMAELDRIEAAVHAGRSDRALERLRDLEAFAIHTGAPWALARVAHAHGLLSEGHVADGRFQEALDHHTRATRPFERARTELAYGELLRRARRRVAARAHLQAALDGFENLGSAPWAERARLELRASGQTTRSRDPSTLRALTPQELQVARFVARGLPTREVAAQLFLSPRTVDFHLRNLFTKLGISSRTELARFPLD
jgi:DNA-binding CsgD family transcriptional regulator